MPDYTLQRNIVNRGVILLSEEQREISTLTVYSQVEREPVVPPSENFKWPVSRTVVGFWQGLFRGHVVAEGEVNYRNQRLLALPSFTLADVAAFTNCVVAATYDRVDRLAALLAGSADNPPILPLDLEVARLEIDALVFRVATGLTLQVTVYGSSLFVPCDSPVEWVEPSGPVRNDESPVLPSPPTEVPVNERDPNGYDLPSEPYDRGTDDDGLSYDPPRPGDPEPPVNGRPVRVRFDYFPRLGFPPYDPAPGREAYTSYVTLANGFPLWDAQITGNPPSGFPWPNAVTVSFRGAENGAIQTGQLSGFQEGQDELTNASLEAI